MSRGSGTGYPLTLRCSQDRLTRDWRSGRSVGRHDVERTGRTKPAPSPTKSHPRKAAHSYEYRCSCGHVGWTAHVDVIRAPRADGAAEIAACDRCGAPSDVAIGKRYRCAACGRPYAQSVPRPAPA